MTDQIQALQLQIKRLHKTISEGSDPFLNNSLTRVSSAEVKLRSAQEKLGALLAQAIEKDEKKRDTARAKEYLRYQKQKRKAKAQGVRGLFYRNRGVGYEGIVDACRRAKSS